MARVSFVAITLNEQDPLRPLAGVVERLGNFWLSRSYFLQVSIIALVLVIKVGFDIELRNIQEAYLPGSLKFPAPAGYVSASFGQVVFAWIFGLENTTTWVATHFLLTALAMTLIVVLVSRNNQVPRAYLILVVVAATSTSTVLLSLGKYDVFTFMGAALLILARTNWIAALGAMIMASGNPEQAILGSLALILLTFIEPFRRYRSRAVFSLAFSVSAWIVVQIWFLSSGIDLGRLALVPVFLGESLSNFAVSPLGEIWSWLGAGWFIAIPALILIETKSRWLLLISLILIPGIATLVTADGARVFGAISFPVFVATGIWLAQVKVGPSRFAKQAVGIFLILSILAPVTIDRPGWFDGQVRGKIMTITNQVLNIE